MNKLAKAYKAEPDSRIRSKILIVIVLYLLVNIYNYQFYLYPVWGYQGFPKFDPAKGFWPLIYACACITAFAATYKIRISTYSRFVTWFVFFFIYTPATVIVAMQGFPADGGFALITALTISMFLMAFIPEIFEGVRKENYANANQSARFNDPSIPITEFRNVKFEYAITAIFLLFMAILVVVYYDVIAFVSLTNVYDQRDIVSDFAGNRSITAYILQWMIRLFAPFMMAVGIIYKRPLLLALGISGMLLGYFVTGSKFIIFVIPLVLLFHRYIIKKREMLATDMGVVFCLTLFFTLLAISIYGEDVEQLPGLILSQIVKRAYSINGMSIGNYYDFFVNHANPFTYYSHLGPIGWFVDYPYGQFGIGQMVGQWQVGLYTYDMSAGFWATDGIAAAGLLGVVAVGAMLGGILTVFNFFTHPKNFQLLCLSSLGCVWMLADTSIFRVIVSGGWPVHFILVYLYTSVPIGNRARKGSFRAATASPTA